jgi:selenocysteine-specific translation elongation factor
VRGAVPGTTAALLGNLAARRELGKVGTQSDIHLHDLKAEGRDVTLIVPDRYPDSVKPLSYAVLGADAAVLVVDRLGPQVGEQILAADAAGLAHGIIVLQEYLQPEQLRPILKGTTLEAWPVLTEADWPRVRSHVASAPARAGADRFTMVPIDHHFNVKGVGAVVLGVVRQGTLRKGETLHAFPDKVICPVRSIQIHDVDHDHAVPGDRVGLALRNTPPEALDRGMVLAPADAPLAVVPVGGAVRAVLRRSPFSRQPLKAGAVVQLGAGMQFVPVRLTADLPAPGQSGALEGTAEKALVHAPGERGILWHADNAPQRVVGAVTLG